MALIPPVASGITYAQPLPPVQGPSSTTGASASEGSGFGKALEGVLSDLQAGEARTDALAEQAATGRLRNVEDYLIAATESQLNMQLTVAVRNKAVEAFNEIMRMQV